MILTIKEAKDKCCFDGGSIWDYCGADECMAWRWFDEKLSIQPERRGYCGLAGRPKIEE